VTGPEHYTEAQRWLEEANDHPLGSPGQIAQLTRAQVHATLAQAAASVQYVTDGCRETIGARQWRTMLAGGRS
jgi:hypothetical protein